MKFSVFNRKFHYWGAIVVAAPILVVIVTGLLLQLKKEIPWVQPPEQHGKGKAPSISFDRILDICRSIPEAEIQSWKDIDRLDVRPGRGMLKVQAKNNWEIQIDTQTGEVLQKAYRRSDIIEAMHDGSWFHDLVKHWLFLPAAVVLLLLWLSGMYMFFHPIIVRRRRRRREAAAARAKAQESGPASATGELP